MLSYATSDQFGLVLLINQGKDSDSIAYTKDVVEAMTDAVLSYGGTYYLPYMRYQTEEQFQSAYPKKQLFFQKKEHYDPNTRFTNYFYEHYK